VANFLLFCLYALEQQKCFSFLISLAWLWEEMNGWLFLRTRFGFSDDGFSYWTLMTCFNCFTVFVKGSCILRMCDTLALH
jgi:hypothetical protein